jgi:transposase
MPKQTLVPDPNRLEVLSLSAERGTIILTARTCGESAPCPMCGRPSSRVHSRYRRRLADLPWQDIPAHLHLWSRRFFCDTPDCPRRIFTERLPSVAAPHARRTDRLRDWLRHVAFALGGEPGARLLRQLGITVCGDTLLTQIRAQALPARPTPRVLSIDDFAFRRGRTYGSILVDLECHRAVDLLPDRSGSGFAAWLASHPGVEFISRDRSGEYADGARLGAPQARQVADRFHLLRNLRDVVLRVLKRHAQLVERVVSPETAAQPLTRFRLDREGTRERTRVEMRARYAAIQQLTQEGMSISAIARALKLHRHTVQKYRTCTSPPQRHYTTRQTSALTPHQGYLVERWRSGCHNARQLWRELAAHGYPGSYHTVARLTGYLRQREYSDKTLPPVATGMTPAQAVGLVVVRPEQRTTQEQRALEQLGALHPEIQTALALFASFAAFIRERTDPPPARQLEQWMTQATASGVKELAAFATKLQQDAEAVLAALSLPYSQGQTEGQVNRLKLLKRSMYGRAKFDLLRGRVLYASAVGR